MSPQYWPDRTPKVPNPYDTCRVLVMPRVLRTVCHVSPSGWTTSAVRTCHVSCTALPRQLYRRATWTVRTVQSSPFFACLTFQTERNIFSIRTPFDEVNIPPELGRRDGCNGTGFVAFRALSFLSIFQALSGFWIQFWISKL